MKKTGTVITFFLIVMIVFVIPVKVYAGVQAIPTKTNYYIQDEYFDIRSYSIEGSNYVNLRDIAQSLSDTSKVFDVDWNASKGSIVLNKGKLYRSTGMEGGSYELKSSTAYAVKSSIQIKDGSAIKSVPFEGYNINGYTYFKLRDIASTLNFQIFWTEDKQFPMRIEPDLNYNEATSYYTGKYVFLKSVNAQKKRLAYDEVEWISIEDKIRISQLGLKEEELRSGYAYNAEEKLEVVPISDDCILYYVYVDGANGLAGASTTLEEFPYRKDYDVCMLGFANGKVTWVHQVYRF